MKEVTYTHGSKWREFSDFSTLVINFDNSTFEFNQSNFNDNDQSVEAYWNTLLTLEGIFELKDEIRALHESCKTTIIHCNVTHVTVMS
jgi:hypothetical protein